LTTSHGTASKSGRLRTHLLARPIARWTVGDDQLRGVEEDGSFDETWLIADWMNWTYLGIGIYLRAQYQASRAKHYSKCKRGRTRAYKETTIYASQMLCMTSQGIDPRREKREEERKGTPTCQAPASRHRAKKCVGKRKGKAKTLLPPQTQKTLSYKRHQEAWKRVWCV